MTKLIIFDLDGTLLDTLGDLAVACNAVLALRVCPSTRWRSTAVSSGTGLCGWWSGRCPSRCAIPIRSRPPGGFRLLLYGPHRCPHHPLCRDSGTAGRTARPRHAAGRRLEQVPGRHGEAGAALFPDIPFAVVSGQRPDVPLKPDPAVDLDILRRTGLSAGEAVHVGDSAIDVQAARAAGIRSVGVTWGFRSREELVGAEADAIIDRPDRLLDLLGC